uniref:Transmembrane protein n=1 Tax=Trypanosoma vivax (strain Y486) TaxID=1055687 RepID=G0U0Z1_TRYVY|nr:hypothetical protein TVY486_0803540 [Trypanosoma vivax Y486]
MDGKKLLSSTEVMRAHVCVCPLRFFFFFFFFFSIFFSFDFSPFLLLLRSYLPKSGHPVFTCVHLISARPCFCFVLSVLPVNSSGCTSIYLFILPPFSFN